MNFNQIEDYYYDLPSELIAQYPNPQRSTSRLLHVNIKNQQILHQHFHDLVAWARPNDLLVLNDTKVIPARLFGVKESGGKIECLVERILSAHEVLAHIRASHAPKINSIIYFANRQFSGQVIHKIDDLYHLKIAGEAPVLTLLERYGAIPLPPYIAHQPTQEDQERYQTIFAHYPGAVAAPTAGLHFDENLLSHLKQKGVKLAYVTLHVGAGTFQPVRVSNLDEHHMHAEWMSFPAETYHAIKKCQQQQGRVIAVGTTVARCLETMAQKHVDHYVGETDLFIRPGFTFQWVDALITNFHLPESTLLVLVSAFGGYELVKKAYALAIEQKYRFFSYGDAMLLASS